LTRHGGFAYAYHDDDDQSGKPSSFIMRRVEPTGENTPHRNSPPISAWPKFMYYNFQKEKKKKKKERVHLDIIERSVLLFLGEWEKIIGLPIGVIRMGGDIRVLLLISSEREWWGVSSCSI